MKRADKAVTTQAWRNIHEALVKSDKLGDAGADLINQGWGELAASSEIADPVRADAMGDAAAEKIAKGMDAAEESCRIMEEIEALALTLANGDPHARNMHKYMSKPASRKTGPYI